MAPRQSVRRSQRRAGTRGSRRNAASGTGRRAAAGERRGTGVGSRQMNDLQTAIGRGHYARHQLFSRARLVAWGHRLRFDAAVALGRQFAGKRVLDYGSGDGTFLALTMLTDHAPAV